MKQSSVQQVLVVAGVLLFIALVVYQKFDAQPTGHFIDETGLFVGKFFLQIVNQHYNSNFTIGNITNFTTSSGVGFLFHSNMTSSGIFNMTMMPANPFEFDPVGKEGINKFMEVYVANLSFINVTMTIPYDEADLGGIDESTLKMYYYNPFTEEWVEIESSVDTKRNVVTGIASHFSTFGVFGSSGGGGSSGGSGSSGSSGGGGGAGNSDRGEGSMDFTVRPVVTTVKFGPKETAQFSIEIENPTSRKQMISIRPEGLSDYITMKTESITLSGHEKTMITPLVFSPEGIKEAVATGRISFENNFHITKFANLLIHVTSGQNVIGLDIKVSEESKKIISGSKMVFSAFIHKYEESSLQKKAVLELTLKDFDNTAFAYTKEEIMVKGEQEIRKSLIIPPGIASGVYFIHGKIAVGEDTALGFDAFEVTSPAQEEPRVLMPAKTKGIALPLVILALMILFILLIRKRRRN